jgi:hypothetical protein
MTLVNLASLSDAIGGIAVVITLIYLAILDRDMWESRKHSIREYLLRPGIDAWWSQNRVLFSKDFVVELDRDG